MSKFISIKCPDVDDPKVRNATIEIFSYDELISGRTYWSWWLKLKHDDGKTECIVPNTPKGSRWPFNTRAEALKKVIEVLEGIQTCE
jgi:hypothetical protein